MKALDTSAVIRFLTQDDEEKAREVREVIEREKAFIPSEVVLECVFVLMSKRLSYRMKKEEVVELLLEFLTNPNIELEDEVYLEALSLWRDAECISFPDVVIALKAQREGLELLSYDEELLKWVRKTF